MSFDKVLSGFTTLALMPGKRMSFSFNFCSIPVVVAPVCLAEFTGLRCLQIEGMKLQRIAILLKAVLQIHEQLEGKQSRDRASTAELNLRNELMQDLKWKEGKVLAFSINRRTLVHSLFATNMHIAVVLDHVPVATQVHKLEIILETREKQLSELQATKDSIEDVLRAELSDYGKKNPAFAKQMRKGTTTVKSLQDFANSIALARKAVDETEREIATIRTETGVLSRQIDEVIICMTTASLHVFFSRVTAILFPLSVQM